MTANEAKKHLKICKESRLFIPKNDVLDTAIQALEEIQEYRAIGTVEELIKEHKELIELSRRYLIDTNELLEYQAIGTVEELQKLKLLFGNENVEISELITKILKEYPEYLSIGTIDEFKALKEKQYNCTIKNLTNECSYKETGCSDCKGYWEIRKLLEKNVAKKSKEVHENEVCIDFICPNCKEAVYGQPYRPNYCKHCGQKLDWEGGAV